MYLTYCLLFSAAGCVKCCRLFEVLQAVCSVAGCLLRAVLQAGLGAVECCVISTRGELGRRGVSCEQQC